MEEGSRGTSLKRSFRDSKEATSKVVEIGRGSNERTKCREDATGATFVASDRSVRSDAPS